MLAMAIGEFNAGKMLETTSSGFYEGDIVVAHFPRPVVLGKNMMAPNLEVIQIDREHYILQKITFTNSSDKQFPVRTYWFFVHELLARDQNLWMIELFNGYRPVKYTVGEN